MQLVLPAGGNGFCKKNRWGDLGADKRLHQVRKTEHLKGRDRGDGIDFGQIWAIKPMVTAWVFLFQANKLFSMYSKYLLILP